MCNILHRTEHTVEIGFYGCYCHPVVMHRTTDIDSTSYRLSAQLIYALPRSCAPLRSLVRVQMTELGAQIHSAFPCHTRGVDYVPFKVDGGINSPYQLVHVGIGAASCSEKRAVLVTPCHLNTLESGLISPTLDRWL